MLGRIIIITVGAGFASYLVVTAVLTILGINPATLHLSKFFRIGYSAINAVLIPFGISGVIGAASRKKTLVRAFVTFQWWLATFILIGLNIFNIFLSKRGRGDFINKCQASLASDPNSLNQCAARANYAENVTFIATCVEGGIMLFLGIVLLIVGTREYNNISLEEETKNLLEKANFKENDEVDEMRNLSPKRSNFNDPSDSGNDRTTSVKRQPSKPTTVNVDLERQNNTNVNRNITNPIIQPDLNITTPLYRKPTLPTIPGNIPPKRETRYPINTNNGPVNRANVTRQPTIPIVNDGPVNRANVTRQPTIPIVNDGPVNRTNITRQPTIPIVNDGPVNRANVTRQPIIPIVNDGPVSRANVTRQPTIPIANDGPINRTNITRQPTIPIVNDGPANRANVTRQPTIPIVNDGPANRANVTRQPTIGNAYAPRNYVGKPQATYPPPQRPLTKQYMNPPQRSISTKQYMNPQQSSQQYKNPPQRSLSTKYINPPLPPPQMKLPPPPLPEANEYGGEYNNYRPKPAMPPYYMGRD